jgi:hypothetical protein
MGRLATKLAVMQGQRLWEVGKDGCGRMLVVLAPQADSGGRQPQGWKCDAPAAAAAAGVSAAWLL